MKCFFDFQVVSDTQKNIAMHDGKLSDLCEIFKTDFQTLRFLAGEPARSNSGKRF